MPPKYGLCCNMEHFWQLGYIYQVEQRINSGKDPVIFSHDLHQQNGKPARYVEAGQVSGGNRFKAFSLRTSFGILLKRENDKPLPLRDRYHIPEWFARFESGH